jgi:hypothetical protein
MLGMLFEGSYAALSTPRRAFAFSKGHGPEFLGYYPRFRIGGEVAEWLYLPLTLVDQAVRRNYWNPTREEHYILDQ